VSKPPALDPEAERWAARFETVPPPDATAQVPVAEEPKRKRSSRWKTQVMGSMVPLEVSAAREEPGPPLSEPAASSMPYAAPAPPPPTASTLIYQDVPSGWRTNVDAASPAIASLRDTVLAQVSARRLCVAVTGVGGARRAQVAAGLGIALAQAGLRVLLVEGDSDAPELHQVLGLSMPPGAGFSQQLTARRQDSRRPWTVMRCSPTLHVLAEGRLRSPGLAASGDFEQALVELREQHHVLVLHAPPQHRTAELRNLRSVTQAVVLVDAQNASIELGEAGLRHLG
jgi:Mrp family chromosome partitioning ATPase